MLRHILLRLIPLEAAEQVTHIMDLQVGTVVKRKVDGKEMIVVQYPWTTIDGKQFSNKVECKFYVENSLMKHGTYNLNEIEVK